MKIIACVKEAIWLPGPAVMTKDGSDVAPEFKQRRISEADEQAAEEAVRIVGGVGHGEAVALTLGPASADNTLRKCLALGMNRAVRISGDPLNDHDPIAIASALARLVEAESPDLVLCGVQSSDFAQQVTGPALAACLGWPCITIAMAIRLEPDRGRAIIHRDIGAGRIEIVEADLPAVITVQLGINTPRTPSFKDVMNAKKTSIQVVEAEADRTAGVRLSGVARYERPARQLQILGEGATDVAEEIKALLNEK